MARYTASPPKVTIEAADPRAVWVRVPLLPGLGSNLDRLHEAAAGIGLYATTARIQPPAEYVRFGFTSAKHATLFRARAIVIVGTIVEPSEPPKTQRQAPAIVMPVLIVSRTAVEAAEFAIDRGLSAADWCFVAHANDLLEKTPATHWLVFAGAWRERKDIASIRMRARDQGFKVPRRGSDHAPDGASVVAGGIKRKPRRREPAG
jgi:hypothetical protein